MSSAAKAYRDPASWPDDLDLLATLPGSDARRALEVSETSQALPEMPSYAEQSNIYSSELNDEAAADDEEEILTNDPEQDASDGERP